MKLDNEQQRQLLLQLLEASTVPGSAVEAVYNLREAIKSADVIK